MSSGVYVTGFELSKLTDLFGSKDEKLLVKLLKDIGEWDPNAGTELVGVMDDRGRALEGDGLKDYENESENEDQKYKQRLAAVLAVIIRGGVPYPAFTPKKKGFLASLLSFKNDFAQFGKTVDQGGSEEDEGFVGAVDMLAELQNHISPKGVLGFRWLGFADYQRYASKKSRRAGILIDYCVYGRPLFGESIDMGDGDTPHYYGYLIREEVGELLELFNTVPSLLEDKNDFGADLKSVLEKIALAGKDVWITTSY